MNALGGLLFREKIRGPGRGIGIVNMCDCEGRRGQERIIECNNLRTRTS